MIDIRSMNESGKFLVYENIIRKPNLTEIIDSDNVKIKTYDKPEIVTDSKSLEKWGNIRKELLDRSLVSKVRNMKLRKVI